MEKNVEIFVDGNWVTISKDRTEAEAHIMLNTLDLSALNAIAIAITDKPIQAWS